MFNTGDVPPYTVCGRRPEAAAARTVRPAASGRARNDPAKVLQMVEAGEGLRADELSGGDRAGRAVWGAWFDCEPRVREWKDTAAPNPEAERRYVDTLRAAFDVPPRAVRVAGLRSADAAGAMTFVRPEDGAFNPNNPNCGALRRPLRPARLL
jgi:hypothetical protein